MRLIDADALMDELENEQPFNWTDSPGEIQEQADLERFKGMVSVAHTIESEPVRMWISVKDRIPKYFVSVLGHMTDAGYFPSVRECYNVGHGFFFPALEEIHPIDFWMEMPEPPKE